MRIIISIFMALNIGVFFSFDINHDGKVTVTDLVQLRQMVEGLTQPSPFADLNYDGRVNEKDLNMLRYKLAYN